MIGWKQACVFDLWKDTTNYGEVLRGPMLGIAPILLRHRVSFPTALVPRLQFWLSSMDGARTLKGRPVFTVAVGITWNDGPVFETPYCLHVVRISVHGASSKLNASVAVLLRNTVFARVISALFFFYFGRWKIGVLKICGFFCGDLDLGFILV